MRPQLRPHWSRIACLLSPTSRTYCFPDSGLTAGLYPAWQLLDLLQHAPASVAWALLAGSCLLFVRRPASPPPPGQLRAAAAGSHKFRLPTCLAAPVVHAPLTPASSGIPPSCRGSLVWRQGEVCHLCLPR